MNAYSDDDAAFDAEQLGHCPLHGARSCTCCPECGADHGHALGCKSADPSDTDVSNALENLVNTTAWIHIDHNRDTSAQRVTAMTDDGGLLSEEATFVREALVALERRLELGKWSKSPKDGAA